MAYNAGLHEILMTRLWDILPTACHTYRQRMEANFMGHYPFVMERERNIAPFMLSSRDGFQEKVYVGDAEYIQWRNELDEEDRIFNVVHLCGPVTRGGGACSYGSKEIRDMLMELAEQPQVAGHIFCIDSPGGSSMAKYDFEQGIAAAREAGQKTIACIDGLCDSAAYAAAALCDEIYYTHPNNEVGCIGTMAAFYTSVTGNENAVTKEKYVELYAEGSPYKNRDFRAAAEGDYSLVIEDLNRSAEDFKEMVKRMRPAVTEEQLLGDTYLAGEVSGTLVDGQKNFQQCVERMMEICGLSEPGTSKPAAPQGGEDGPDEDVAKTAQEELETNHNQKLTEMNKQYVNIQNALSQPELASDAKNALYLNEAQCDALENHLASCEQRSDALDAKMNEIEALNAKIADMEKAHNEAMENAKAENLKAVEEAVAAKNSEIETMKADHQKELQELKDDTLGQLQDLNSKIEDLNKQLEAAKTSLTEKEAEIEEMEKAGTAQLKAGAPADNSVEADTKTDNRVCKPNMTAKERREALAKQWGRPQY